MTAQSVCVCVWGGGCGDITDLMIISQVSATGHSGFPLLLPVTTHTHLFMHLWPFPWQGSPPPPRGPTKFSASYGVFTYSVRFLCRKISPVTTRRATETVCSDLNIEMNATHRTAGVKSEGL